MAAELPPPDAPAATAWLRAPEGGLRAVPLAEPIPADAVWIDLHRPSREQELLVERALAIEIPTREERLGIEDSNRVYREGKAVYLTTTMLIGTDTGMPLSTAVTFVHLPRVVVTLRYDTPRSFRVFAERVARERQPVDNHDVLVGILEGTIERLADMVERVAAQLDAHARAVFQKRDGRDVDLHAVLIDTGRLNRELGKIRESLIDKGRLVHFADEACREWLGKPERDRLHTVVRDAQTLADHAGFFANQVTVLVDATVGLISIEQNRVIKIFTIVAVLFVPPTLVASVYGMNFDVMPELKWAMGYPFSIVLMVLSAVVPWLIFKWKRWL